jgi:hypothetical protein
MATPTPVFPAAVATDAQLKVANNLIQAKLRVAVDAVNTILFLDSATGFKPNSLVSIDQEIVAIESVTTTPNPALTVASGGRGFDGTSAAAHSAGAKVSIFIDAWHHNVLAAEVKAVQAFLGPNGQNLTNLAGYQSTGYDFAPQSPGGSLVAGSNSVTLTPVPKGVNGTDRFHYLYISGGTGAAEAVKITGGTAVAGAASGTVIFTCANAHSGAWTIRSASSGIKEASIAQNDIGTVTVPAGTYKLYGPLILPTTMSLEGMGAYATFLQAQAGADPAIVIVNYDKTEGTGFFGEHRNYQLQGPESGRGFWIGGNVLGISNTWQGDQVRVSNCYFCMFNQTLVIQGGNFCVFTRSMFAPLSTGLGTAIYIPAGGGSLQPLEFYGCVITGQNIAVQMDNGNFGSAYILYMGGQVSGLLTGSELGWESHGTHFEPNVQNQMIVNTTTGAIVKIYGGLISVHLNTLMASAISITGTGSSCTIEGTTILCDGAQTVTNFVTFGATSNFRLKDLIVTPAGTFTRLYNFPSGVPPVCSIDLGASFVQITAAAALVFPQGSLPFRSVVSLIGSTVGGAGITSVSGLATGQEGLINCLQTQTFTTGASIGNTITLTPNVPYTYSFDGTRIWLR